MRVFKRILLVIAAALVALAGLAAYRIGPRNVLGMLRYDQRKEGTLKPGGAAPDVLLYALDGATRVHLSDSIGPRPLVLVFGSYT